MLGSANALKCRSNNDPFAYVQNPSSLFILILVLWLPTCLTACTSVDRLFPWEKSKDEADKTWAKSTERPFKQPTLKPPKNRYFSLPGHGKVVAMTFDDGPRPWTMDLLDSLKERNIKATFFVVGRVVKTYPEVIKRIAAEGHELANHTWSHPRNMARMPQRVVRRELELCRDAIVEVAGVKPRVFRPPGGSFTKDQSAWIYDEFDYVNIMWSVDPEDWKRPGAEVITSRIMNGWEKSKGTHDGAIILAHDLHQPTVKAMPATLDALQIEGYSFLTVSELLALDRPEAQLMMYPAWVDEDTVKLSPDAKPVTVKKANVIEP